MRIVVTDPIHEAGLEQLRAAGHEVIEATAAEPADLPAVLSGADAIVVRSGTIVTADLLDQLDELAVIARAGIGVDNIDLEAATEAGVLVVNAPTGGVDAVTEHTLTLVFALMRRLPHVDREMHTGAWPKPTYEASAVRDATMGVVGLGRIGRSVAAVADSLGMPLVGYDPYVADGALADIPIDVASFEACLSAADVVTVHTPLTDETAHLVDAEALSTLGPGYLVNCARGGIVDETALIEALEDGPLRGAALDVFETEPLPADDPLRDREDVILTPHIGATSDAAQRTIAEEVAEQLIAIDRDETPTHPVNDPPSV